MSCPRATIAALLDLQIRRCSGSVQAPPYRVVVTGHDRDTKVHHHGGTGAAEQRIRIVRGAKNIAGVGNAGRVGRRVGHRIALAERGQQIVQVLWPQCIAHYAWCRPPRWIVRPQCPRCIADAGHINVAGGAAGTGQIAQRNVVEIRTANEQAPCAVHRNGRGRLHIRAHFGLHPLPLSRAVEARYEKVLIRAGGVDDGTIVEIQRIAEGAGSIDLAFAVHGNIIHLCHVIGYTRAGG